MSDFVAFVLAASTAATPPAAPEPNHAAEIKLFATTFAIAKTASDRCSDIVVNLPMLADVQGRMHISDADQTAMVAEGKAAMEVLAQAIADAPSTQAWCDASYRLYGPEGSMIRNLMRRDGKL